MLTRHHLCPEERSRVWRTSPSYCAGPAGLWNQSGSVCEWQRATNTNTSGLIWVDDDMPTFGSYPSSFCCSPPTLWHSCWAARWLDTQSDVPRGWRPRWRKEPRTSRGRNCGARACWRDFEESSHWASGPFHPPGDDRSQKNESCG